jgi:predicted TPR repeat methyltransferase
MLEKARALAVYDRLVNADIVSHLVATSDIHDLIVAADVFIYVGDLEPVFRAARRVMSAGGIFCFSVEIARSANFELLPSLRYAHSESYLRGLAEAHGFDVLAAIREPLRNDQRDAIEGLFVYLRREAGNPRQFNAG